MNDPWKLTDLQVLARTLYGEARGQPIEGLKAVASVIMNRVDPAISWWGNSPKEVCLAPWQFSAWNRSDPNRHLMLEVADSTLQALAMLPIAEEAISGRLLDNTQGSTHYINPAVANPYWARGLKPVIVIGDHAFYNNVR